MAPQNEGAGSWLDALRAGPTVGAAIGLAVAGVALREVEALPAPHQANFVTVTALAWSAVGVAAALSGALFGALWRRCGARRAPWCGWFAVGAWVGVAWLFDGLGLDAGAELVALATLVAVAVVVLGWLGERVALLEDPRVWAAVGVAAHGALLWRVASSSPAVQGLHGAELWLAALLPPAALLLPAFARGTRAFATGIVAAAVVGLVGAVGVPALAGEEPPDAEPAPNVLLVTVDTLRADEVGCYGGEQAATPTMDALAAEGVLFEAVQSPVPMTYPAHTSLLTGLDPGNHGVINNMPWALSPELVTLPDALARRKGYATAAFVSGFTLKRNASRLFQRFALYDDTFSPLRTVPDAFVDSGLVSAIRALGDVIGWKLRRLRYGGDRPADRTVSSAIEWLERERDTPFFLWVHLFDPHLPYEPPAEFLRRHDADYAGGLDGFWYRVPPERKREIVEGRPRDVEHLRALYRGEVTFADAEVGRLLDALERTGHADDTWVVLTSDHGESHGEHDYWFDHSYFLYQTCLAVPLIVRPPAGAATRAPGSRIAQPVRLIDLAPTLAELTGIGELWPKGDGLSLAPVFAGSAVPAGAERAFSVTYDLRVDNQRYLLAVRDGRWKYVRTATRWDDLWLLPEVEELYDLASDPGETRPLTDSDQLARMRALADTRFDAWRSGDRAAAETLSDADRARLEDIGYF